MPSSPFLEEVIATLSGMAIYALGDLTPEIHPDAYVHPDAVVIGAVKIGAHSSVWPHAVLRGDDGEIHIGERSSIQDGTVVHTTPWSFTTVGNDCVIGHIVHLEGCIIKDGAQVSSGSVVLHHAVIETGAIVAANAVVLNNMHVPAGALAVGAPAVIKEGRARAEEIAVGAQIYVDKAARFKKEMRLIG